MSWCPARRRTSNVDVEYRRIRFEFVASARCEWVDDNKEGVERKVASMISSLNPTIWRVVRWVERER